MTGQRTNSGSIPTNWLLQLMEPGTRRAGWVLGTDVDGIGFVAEYGQPADGSKPEGAVAAWVAKCLTVTGVALLPAGVHTWSVELHDDET